MHAIGGKGPQRLAEGIERAGADIAIDDADRANDQSDKALPADAIPRLIHMRRRHGSPLMPFAYEHKHMPHCRTASKLMQVRFFCEARRRMRGWEGSVAIRSAASIHIPL
ncbi:hypothetical protein A4U53_018330 [Rhizobium ruizarguesonis]|uniref:Uncharacterized protein n=1 Tax=Rhizobium ruizarguesonis TaxID=2081791 RepID=A0ACD5EV00_9HYPH